MGGAGSAFGQSPAKKGKGKGAPAQAGTAEERALATRLLVVPPGNDGLVRLPLRILVARDVTMSRMGVMMNAWVNTNDLARVVVPELNRIWRPARIEWAVESIVEQRMSAQELASKQASLRAILASQRDEAGKADAERVPMIRSFFEPRLGHPVAHNLFLFPYLGATSQGVAGKGGNAAYVGLWTDKPSNGTRPPQPVILDEPLPFKIGSLGRTCAHELGHNLNLTHPARDETPGVARLMGGGRQGYDFTAAEIATARAAALDRARQIQAWAK